jgi:hypothetical protein
MTNYNFDPIEKEDRLDQNIRERDVFNFYPSDYHLLNTIYEYIILFEHILRAILLCVEA